MSIIGVAFRPLVNHLPAPGCERSLQILSDRAAFGRGTRAVVGDHARRAPPGLVEFKGFLYQAASWKTARRVVAKVEHHPGELFPRVGFIVTRLTRQGKRHRFSGEGEAQNGNSG